MDEEGNEDDDKGVKDVSLVINEKKWVKWKKWEIKEKKKNIKWVKKKGGEGKVYMKM